jgi:hypothetical protein
MEELGANLSSEKEGEITLDESLGGDVTEGVEAPGTGFSAVIDSSMLSGEGTASKSGNINFTAEELALMNNACSHDSVTNAPMLVAWIYKNVDEEPTLIAGLKYLLMHLSTGDGMIFI